MLSVSRMCSFEASHIGLERMLVSHLSISWPGNIAHGMSDSPNTRGHDISA